MAMQLAYGFSFSVFLLLPKFMAVALHAGPLAIGVVSAMLGVGCVAAVPLLGTHLERRGVRAPILIGNLMLAVGALGFAFVDSVGPLAALLRGLHGMSWTLVFNAGMTLTTMIAPPGRMAQAIGIYGSTNLISNALAPAVAEPLMNVVGYRPVFAGAAAVALVAWWLGLRLQVPPREPGPRQPVSLVGLLRRPHVRALTIVVALSGVALGVMFTFHQPFALQLGMTHVSGFFIGYTAGALLVRIGGGRLVDRIGHRRAMVWSLVLYGAVTAAMSLLTPGRLAPLGFLFGLAHGTFFPASLALAVSGTEPVARGHVLALLNGALMGGMMLVPAVGAAAGAVGYPAIFLVSGAVVLSALLFIPRGR